MPGPDTESGGVRSRLREDPPRVESVDQLSAAVRHAVGTHTHVHDMDYLPDGGAVAYLGVSMARDTTDAAQGNREITFVNIAPVGAIMAEPVPEDDEYVLDIPDRDDLTEALRRREEYEATHRMEILPMLLNMLEDRREMHYDEADEYGIHDIDSLDELDLEDEEWFQLGRAVGMQKMAGLAHRVLNQRLESAYRGSRRWSSPAYEVIRGRRTKDLPPLPEEVDVQ